MTSPICPPHEWTNDIRQPYKGCKKCGWAPTHQAHRDEKAPPHKVLGPLEFRAEDVASMLLLSADKREPQEVYSIIACEINRLLAERIDSLQTVLGRVDPQSGKFNIWEGTIPTHRARLVRLEKLEGK